MRLSYNGREHLDVTTTDSTGGTLDVTFDGGTTWHPMEIVDTTHARVLIAGPGATGNPPETVVLQPGRYPVSVRLTRYAEQIVREVEETLDVLVQDTGRASAGVCYPTTADWGCAPDAYLEQLDPSLRARVEALAWRTLQRLLGGSLALCPTVVRPCAARCGGGTYYDAPVVGGRRYGPYIGVDGAWRNGCGCAGASYCSCTALSEVRLQGPVGRVTRVLVNGVELPATAYRVDNGDRLVRLDGETWPACQDMTVADDEAGAFAVEYFTGDAPDALADWAAGVLAYEFSLACKGGKCRLPAGVTSVVRNGVTMEIRSDLFTGGSTGIRELDAYISSINPFGLRARPTVMSPDTLARAGRRQTWGS